MNTSKAAVVVSAIIGKISSLIGYVFGLFGIVGFFTEISRDKDVYGIVLSIICMALAAFLITKGVKDKHIIKRFKRYVSLISTQQMTSIDSIAASTSQSVDFVKKDLQKMIYKKFFANASVDVAANEIIIGNRMAFTPTSPTAPTQAQTSAQPELEMFTCSGCGASGTKPKGVLGNCDYCGSPLQ